MFSQLPNGFVLNSNFKIIRPSAESVPYVRSPSRRLGLQNWTLDQPAEFDLAKKVARFQKEGSVEWSGEEFEALVRRGIFLLPEEVSAETKFKCDAEQLQKNRSAELTHLAKAGKESELVLNPDLYFSDAGDRPSDVSELDDSQCIDTSGAVVWVKDPITKITSPFSLQGRILQNFLKVYREKERIQNLDLESLGLLLSIQAILPEDWKKTAESSIIRNYRNAGKSIAANGYGIVEKVLHPLQIEAMQSYYASIIREGWVYFPHSGGRATGQSDYSNRMNLHNESIAHFFHQQMGPFISMVMNKAWKPSYCFFASYLPGGSLEKHLDREQCGISLSLLVDYIPNRGGGPTWPLYIEIKKPGGTDEAVKLLWDIGQAGIFRGEDFPHWRDQLTGDHSYTGIFLHFVPDDFVGHLG